VVSTARQSLEWRNTMMGTELSALVGALFVLLAGANIWLMFVRMGPGRTGPNAARLTQAHRAGCYLYLALYLIMLYYTWRAERWRAATRSRRHHRSHAAMWTLP
jgi:hypothetical protein